MKVIDKKLLFINSSERESGTISDFKVTIPSHLLTCEPNQKMRLVLNDLVLPFTWYNVQSTNRTFTLQEGAVSYAVEIPMGSYNVTQLRDTLQSLMTSLSASQNSSNPHTYTLLFDSISSKFSFSHSSLAEGQTSRLIFAREGSAHKLLGFEVGSVNDFVSQGGGVGRVLSSRPVSMMLTDALHFHTNLLNTNVDKSTGLMSDFHLSDVFAKIAINTSPFNNLIYFNTNDDYLVNISERRITEFRFWFTTGEHAYIDLNDDFSFTLKIEIYEDDERRMVDQNTGIGELLRLMVVQQHALLNRKAGE